MAPQWFKDLYKAYRSHSINQEIVNRVKDMIQKEHSLGSREAFDLVREALQVIAARSYALRPASPSFYTFTQVADCYDFLQTRLKCA